MLKVSAHKLIVPIMVLVNWVNVSAIQVSQESAVKMAAAPPAVQKNLDLASLGYVSANQDMAVKIAQRNSSVPLPILRPNALGVAFVNLENVTASLVSAVKIALIPAREIPLTLKIPTSVPKIVTVTVYASPELVIASMDMKEKIALS
jgi:hypothetical protein